MKKTYTNQETGFVLEVDGPVIKYSGPGYPEEKMHLGNADYAAGLAKRTAMHLRLTPTNEEKKHESIHSKPLR